MIRVVDALSVSQVYVVSLVVVAGDEVPMSGLWLPRKEVVLKLDRVLHSPVTALDLAFLSESRENLHSPNLAEISARHRVAARAGDCENPLIPT